MVSRDTPLPSQGPTARLLDVEPRAGKQTGDPAEAPDSSFKPARKGVCFSCSARWGHRESLRQITLRPFRRLSQGFSCWLNSAGPSSWGNAPPASSKVSSREIAFCKRTSGASLNRHQPSSSPQSTAGAAACGASRAGGGGSWPATPWPMLMPAAPRSGGPGGAGAQSALTQFAVADHGKCVSGIGMPKRSSRGVRGDQRDQQLPAANSRAKQGSPTRPLQAVAAKGGRARGNGEPAKWVRQGGRQQRGPHRSQGKNNGAAERHQGCPSEMAHPAQPGACTPLRERPHLGAPRGDWSRRRAGWAEIAEAESGEAIRTQQPAAASGPTPCGRQWPLPQPKTVNQQQGRMAWIPNAAASGRPSPGHRQTAMFAPIDAARCDRLGKRFHTPEPIPTSEDLTIGSFRPSASRSGFFSGQPRRRRGSLACFLARQACGTAAAAGART